MQHNSLMPPGQDGPVRLPPHTQDMARPPFVRPGIPPPPHSGHPSVCFPFILEFGGTSSLWCVLYSNLSVHRERERKLHNLRSFICEPP